MPQRIAIDFVSPLPPVRSGIADYSRDLLPELEANCDLRVIWLPDQPVHQELVERWRPVAATETGSNGRLPLYQVGNNRYHEAVVELALERPGVVTLHDVVLHHLLVEQTLGRALLEPYLERLALDHGWVGELAARARQWGELGAAAMFGLAAHRTILRSQRGIVVHSNWAAARVTEEDPDVRVRTVPMGIPLPPEPDRDAGLAFRRRLRIGPRTPLIGSFGFQTPIKRTDAVIAALVRPELADTHLLIVGEVSPTIDFAETAAHWGVSARVHCMGFLGFEEFEKAITACDLCVNLRYPTAGETSASLLRVLAIGRPAIVSDYAHAAELPDEVAVKIPLGQEEIDALAKRVGALLSDRHRLQEMSVRAREFVAREHDPGRAARLLVDACVELAVAEPLAPKAPEVEPPTTLLWREIRGELEVEGCEPPWPPGQARRLKIRLTNHGAARWLSTRRGVGGVVIEVQWRRSPWHPAGKTTWIDLPRELEPGASREVELFVRRPMAEEMLVIEPHLQGVCGFNALGGPRWVRFL